jgi:hypothetical protein
MLIDRYSNRLVTNSLEISSLGFAPSSFGRDSIYWIKQYEYECSGPSSNKHYVGICGGRFDDLRNPYANELSASAGKFYNLFLTLARSAKDDQPTACASKEINMQSVFISDFCIALAGKDLLIGGVYTLNAFDLSHPHLLSWFMFDESSVLPRDTQRTPSLLDTIHRSEFTQLAGLFSYDTLLNTYYCENAGRS